MAKTYNTEDSQVVTDPSTNSALCCLYMGERTGSLVFSRMWLYMKVLVSMGDYIQTFYSSEGLDSTANALSTIGCPAVNRVSG